MGAGGGDFPNSPCVLIPLQRPLKREYPKFNTHNTTGIPLKRTRRRVKYPPSLTLSNSVHHTDEEPLSLFLSFSTYNNVDLIIGTYTPYRASYVHIRKNKKGPKTVMDYETMVIIMAMIII